MKTMTLTEARNQLLKVAEEIERRPEQVVQITKRGKKVMTLLSTEVYEALVETLEIVADESAYAKLRRAIKEIDAGKGRSWTAARAELDLTE